MGENTTKHLELTKPGQETYIDIRWFKGNRTNRIAFYRKALNGDKVLYAGDFCPSEDNCLGSSPKGELNILTGDLTIWKVNLNDEGPYFYDFFIDNDNENVNTGSDYQIDLIVYGTFWSGNFSVLRTCQTLLLLVSSPVFVFFFIVQN